MDRLNLRDLVSISMDGPSVNWKLFDLFQKDHAEQYGGAQFICVGKGLVQRFLQDKLLTDTSAGRNKKGDIILQHFDSFLSLESRSEDFLSFPPMQKRLDIFLRSAMEPYPELWGFCKKLLILSHGQATVERGFSINKEVESDNIQEDNVVTRRLVCDYITQHGGFTQVPLSKALFESVARARTRYRAHLETERKKREAKS